jgi:isopentenyl diphosphate isomerase/L-lactate dehydrogenase-like FMN-dependent dehydrogenase
MARDRLPKVVFDYIDGGADEETTLRENCRIFDDVTFRPRNAVATASCDLRTTVLFDVRLAVPARAARQQPAVLSARRAASRAAEAGTRILSTLSDVGWKTSAATSGTAWYQLYWWWTGGSAEGIARARRRLSPRRHRRHSRGVRAWRAQRHRELVTRNP